MDSKLIKKIQTRKEEGTHRSLSLFSGAIDFHSNDYLGLSQKVLPNLPIGSTGSRLIAGNSMEAIECEKFIASYFRSASALVFNSGYDANLGLFSSVPQKGDTVLYDAHIHASIRDGIRLSHAKSYSFAHNDLASFEAKLKMAEGTIYVAIESLYSMDGDFAALPEILALCQQYGANLMVDEAHAVGVFGRGICCQKGLEKAVFARVVTFGKAYGVHGAAVLGSDLLSDYLINFARSFIYTTAMSPASYAQMVEQINHSHDLEIKEKLWRNIDAYLAFRMEVEPEMMFHRSPIQMVCYQNREQLVEKVSLLQKNNIAIKPIFAPTVPKEKEGVRICLHAFNSLEEIQLLCSLL